MATGRPIKEIRNRYDHEWLLIRVVKENPKTNEPLTGCLLAHHPNPVELHLKAKRFKGDLLTIYSEDWPQDLAACFHEK